MERHIFTVTEVNELVKLLLDQEPMLSGICVRGEISNYKMYPSGHHYFSLKDQTGAIRCVMFKGQAMRPSAEPIVLYSISFIIAIYPHNPDGIRLF